MNKKRLMRASECVCECACERVCEHVCACACVCAWRVRTCACVCVACVHVHVCVRVARVCTCACAHAKLTTVKRRSAPDSQLASPESFSSMICAGRHTHTHMHTRSDCRWCARALPCDALRDCQPNPNRMGIATVSVCLRRFRGCAANWLHKVLLPKVNVARPIKICQYHYYLPTFFPTRVVQIRCQSDMPP